MLVLMCICWSVILQTQRTRDVYFLSHLMEDKLFFEEFEVDDSHVKKIFFDIGEVTEFWQWLQGPLASTIANPDWDSERDAVPASGFIHGHNRMLGPVRLRQVRASCGVGLGTEGVCSVWPALLRCSRWRVFMAVEGAKR